MEFHHIIKKALITEKSTILRDAHNQYNFEIHRQANKIEVGQAIEKLFKVKVVNVRIMNVPGKKKRTGRFVGERPSWKKAVVTLAQGNRIEALDGV
jgi:large subunit ribosomal protein L23